MITRVDPLLEFRTFTWPPTCLRRACVAMMSLVETLAARIRRDLKLELGPAAPQLPQGPLDRLPERERVLVRAGQAVSNGDMASAVEMLAALVARYPDHEEAYVRLAELHRVELGQPIQAVLTLESASRANPTSSYLIYQYGYALLFSGRYDEALEQFETYVGLRPDEANAHDSLAGVPLQPVGHPRARRGRRRDRIRGGACDPA